MGRQTAHRQKIRSRRMRAMARDYAEGAPHSKREDGGFTSSANGRTYKQGTAEKAAHAAWRDNKRARLVCVKDSAGTEHYFARTMWADGQRYVLKHRPA